MAAILSSLLEPELQLCSTGLLQSEHWRMLFEFGCFSDESSDELLGNPPLSLSRPHSETLGPREDSSELLTFSGNSLMP